jgi:hypothetical protein
MKKKRDKNEAATNVAMTIEKLNGLSTTKLNII